MNYLTYGPVPSRRLGHSLGINNIPPKRCTYSCLYCQLGNTNKMQVRRDSFYEAIAIAKDARDRVEQAREKKEPIDYLTFVPDGEPTLDVNIGNEIEILKSHGLKVAVITNASLLWQTDVRHSLQNADLVSLKVDSVSKELWRRINRPHNSLKLEIVLDGMLKFASIFRGKLITETMMVRSINDESEELEGIASFISKLKPATAYLAIPTRPPARRMIMTPDEQNLNMAYQIFSSRLSSVEYLIGYEGNAFAFTGNVEDDLLGITSVHPMMKEAVLEFLKKAGAEWGIVNKLIETGALMELEYQGKKFYMRKLPLAPDKLNDPGDSQAF